MFINSKFISTNQIKEIQTFFLVFGDLILHFQLLTYKPRFTSRNMDLVLISRLENPAVKLLVQTLQKMKARMVFYLLLEQENV